MINLTRAHIDFVPLVGCELSDVDRPASVLPLVVGCKLSDVVL